MKSLALLLTLTLSVCSLSAQPLIPFIKQHIQVEKSHPEKLHWQLATFNGLPEGRAGHIAASSDTGDFIAIASDNFGSSYTVYSLKHDALDAGWMTGMHITGYDIGRIYYQKPFFVITAKNIEDNIEGDHQPCIFISDSNGTYWSDADFINIGSDSAKSCTKHAFKNTSFIDIGSDSADSFHFSHTDLNSNKKYIFNVESHAFYPINRIETAPFPAIARNQDTYIGVGSDGTTYKAQAPVAKK